MNGYMDTDWEVIVVGGTGLIELFKAADKHDMLGRCSRSALKP